MSWDIELAQEFKKRDNSSPSGPLLGQVLSTNPLKIGILNNKVFLDEENSYLCSNVVENYQRNLILELEPSTIYNSSKLTFKDVLQINDSVLILPTEDMQKFFIIDKVVI